MCSSYFHQTEDDRAVPFYCLYVCLLIFHTTVSIQIVDVITKLHKQAIFVKLISLSLDPCKMWSENYRHPFLRNLRLILSLLSVIESDVSPMGSKNGCTGQ